MALSPGCTAALAIKNVIPRQGTRKPETLFQHIWKVHTMATGPTLVRLLDWHGERQSHHGFHDASVLVQIPAYLEGAADGHGLAHALHLGGQLRLGPRELLKGEAGDLHTPAPLSKPVPARISLVASGQLCSGSEASAGCSAES